jgi:hypothetical protein
MLVDCELLEAIAAGPVKDTAFAGIGEKYVARREYASAREFASVCDHVDFLIAMSESREELARALGDLRRRLTVANRGAAQQ